jgi:hypothetical protein
MCIIRAVPVVQLSQEGITAFDCESRRKQFTYHTRGIAKRFGLNASSLQQAQPEIAERSFAIVAHRSAFFSFTIVPIAL